MSEIQVDTDKLRAYAQKIKKAHDNLKWADEYLNDLYFKVKLGGIWDLLCANKIGDIRWALRRCWLYLEQTAADFEEIEQLLIKEDPAGFQVKSVGFIERTDTKLQNDITIYKCFRNLLKHVNEIMYATDAIYEEKTKRLQRTAIEERIPDFIKDTVKTLRKLSQDDLTEGDLIDLAISSEIEHLAAASCFAGGGLASLKLLALLKSAQYLVSGETGKMYDDMQSDMLAQFKDWDLIGGLADGMEGLLDIIGGGIIEVGFGTVGALVDGGIDVGKATGYGNIVLPGTIALYKEYTDGASPGEVLDNAGKTIQKKLDEFTDGLSDAVNKVTDPLTDGCKKAVSLLVDLIEEAGE